MAIQFLPREEDDLAQILGSLGGIGIGALGGYLGGTASKPGKIKKFESFGATPEQAQALAGSSDALQNTWLREKMKEQRESFGDLFPPMNVTQKKDPTGVPALDALSSPEQQQTSQQTGQTTQQQAPDINQMIGSRSVEDLQKWRDKVLHSGRNQKIIGDAVSILDRQISEKMKQESAMRKEKLEEKKLSLAEQREISKETKPFFDKVIKDSKAAKDNNMRLDKMETLIERGRLTSPKLASLLETVSKGVFGFGIDLHSFLDPDSEEFRKLSNDFLKNAKEIFGSRLTDSDLKAFLTTVPTLSQSDPAKMRVINNLKIFNEAANADAEAMHEIIEENGGRRPRNLENLTEKRAKIKRDKLAEEFKKGTRDDVEANIHEQIKKLSAGYDKAKSQGIIPYSDLESEY